ncbi:MAG: ARMT1-like domain-containing protein [Candidatus Bathyarchaeia archaeon]
MKVGSRCGYCLIHRGYMEIIRATGDEKLRFEAVRGLLKLMGEKFNPEAVPSRLGSERDRLIRRVTGCADPYREMKRRANMEALRLLPALEEFLEGQHEDERLRTALRLSCLGNIIEYDVPGHSHDINEVLGRFEAEGLYIDDTEAFKRLLGPGVEVLLLTDNAGEIALDRLLVRELKSLGCRVVVAVKGGPALNDALMEDAMATGMAEEADMVVDTGSDAIGINLEEASEEFRRRFREADIILAKGMANWETLTEEPVHHPTLFILRTKCEPVASSIGAPLEKNIVKLVPAGWSL